MVVINSQLFNNATIINQPELKRRLQKNPELTITKILQNNNTDEWIKIRKIINFKV